MWGWRQRCVELFVFAPGPSQTDREILQAAKQTSAVFALEAEAPPPDPGLV